MITDEMKVMMFQLTHHKPYTVDFETAVQYFQFAKSGHLFVSCVDEAIAKQNLVDALRLITVLRLDDIRYVDSVVLPLAMQRSNVAHVTDCLDVLPSFRMPLIEGLRDNNE